MTMTTTPEHLKALADDWVAAETIAHAHRTEHGIDNPEFDRYAAASYAAKLAIWQACGNTRAGGTTADWHAAEAYVCNQLQ